MKLAEAAPTRRQKVELKEQAIMEAARDAFLENGYDGTRMADIARRAGIAEGTVYLYFRTKNDLMRAFIAGFWADLTEHAIIAVEGIDAPLAALSALATFHIETLIERFDIVQLTQSEPVHPKTSQQNREYMRTYVQVFDDIWRRGVDRCIFESETPLWLVRDIFFGTLEYSARTIKFHPERSAKLVVENLIMVIEQRHRALNAEPPQTIANSDAFLDRLETLVDRLEGVAGSQ
ncbi:TetR/AcrR family transcriptional regulator [Alterisphingorhabdus coralli]|uniref:TetR/AcrR family transcriptional regulator n=1 Tax=Alterisphingorhabdus coralli TaxID=3071408 RepID=A0AA97I0K7_9SPHN|nr:TetR/AcrR family transcriptional regulator [Parasphingorhabdus sp. SCSIO 66989]WOE73865.1 TetR/AcrR family transcriptional regulator [Parasphingorhabdus sp. SCSIO 66989]